MCGLHKDELPYRNRQDLTVLNRVYRLGVTLSHPLTQTKCRQYVNKIWPEGRGETRWRQALLGLDHMDDPYATWLFAPLWGVDRDPQWRQTMAYRIFHLLSEYDIPDFWQDQRMTLRDWKFLVKCYPMIRLQMQAGSFINTLLLMELNPIGLNPDETRASLRQSRFAKARAKARAKLELS